MSKLKSDCGLRSVPLVMKVFKKKHFFTYDEAERWLRSTGVKNDGVIRKDPKGKFYIFVE